MEGIGAAPGDGSFRSLRPAARKMLWLLPALTVLWTNLHGGFVAGLILIAAYTAGGLLEAHRWAGGGRAAVIVRVKPFFLLRRFVHTGDPGKSVFHRSS